MKESTGELSSTVIVVISIGILMIFLSTALYPIIKNNFNQQTSCDKARCSSIPDDNGMVDCVVDDKNIKCKYKG